MIGAFEVEVTVHSYLNPTGRCDECREDNNPDIPGCCDESTITPLNETCPVACDPTTIVCIRPVRSTGVHCQLENQQLGAHLFRDTNILNFQFITFFGMPNPRPVTSVEAWEVSQ